MRGRPCSLAVHQTGPFRPRARERYGKTNAPLAGRLESLYTRKLIDFSFACESEAEIKVASLIELRVASFRSFKGENRDSVLASTGNYPESSKVVALKNTSVPRVLRGLKMV